MYNLLAKGLTLMKQHLKKLLPVRARLLHDGAATAAFLALTTGINALAMHLPGAPGSVPLLYILAVLLTALYTAGYFWGLLCAALGMIGSNYFFTYPYFTFDFSLRGSSLSFAIMLAVALVTSALATSLKEREAAAQARERRMQALNAVSMRLLTARDERAAAALAAECICASLKRPVRVFLKSAPDTPFTAGTFSGPLGEEAQAVQAIFSGSGGAGFGHPLAGECAFSYYPFAVEEHVSAAVGVLTRDLAPPTQEEQAFFNLILTQFSLFFESLRLADERHRAEAESQKEHMRASLLRAISHDLRTPLTCILGANAVLLERGEHLEAQDRTRLLRDIGEEADWLLHMVENVLSVTKVSAGAPSLHKKPEPVEEVLAQAVRHIATRHPGTALAVQAPEEFIMAPMDATLIEQVLINLIENAVEHSGSAAPVEVRAYAENGSAVFEVRDHGRGLPREMLGGRFDPFCAKESAHSDRSRGLGVGLSICQAIITAHGGAILAENAPEGGARMRFTLPL